MLKTGAGLRGIEVKSSMTYHPGFEKALKQMDGWIGSPITGKAVVYAGNMENTACEIKLLNYSRLRELLE